MSSNQKESIRSIFPYHDFLFTLWFPSINSRKNCRFQFLKRCDAFGPAVHNIQTFPAILVREQVFNTSATGGGKKRSLRSLTLSATNSNTPRGSSIANHTASVMSLSLAH